MTITQLLLASPITGLFFLKQVQWWKRGLTLKLNRTNKRSGTVCVPIQKTSCELITQTICCLFPIQVTPDTNSCHTISATKTTHCCNAHQSLPLGFLHYRIAGKFDRELNLVVGQSGLKLPN